MPEDTDAGPAEKPVPRFFSGRAFGAERPKKTGNFRFYEQFHFMFPDAIICSVMFSRIKKTESGVIRMNEGFSIWLGLMDFLNPIIYTLFFVTLLRGLKARNADPGMIKVLTFGAILSLTAGYIIALGKTIVGLGLIKFTLPVPLFYATDIGFLISGVTMLLIYKNKTYKGLPAWVKIVVPVLFIALSVFVCVSQGANAGAQLTAAIGTFLIYGTMIAFAAREKNWLAMVLAIIPILTTAALIPYSASVDLTDPATHWVIEPTNIAGQLALWLSAVVFFRKKK